MRSPPWIAIYYLCGLFFFTIILVAIVGQSRVLKYAATTKPYAGFLSQLIEKDSPNSETGQKIICLGDSNNHFPPSLKYDRSSEHVTIYLGSLIQETVRASVPNSRVIEWAFPAADMFSYYCIYFETEKSNPDLIIIPINWRLFGAEGVENQHVRVTYPWISALVPFRATVPQGHTDPLRYSGITLLKRVGYRFLLYSLYPIGIKWWAHEAMELQRDPEHTGRNNRPAEGGQPAIDEEAQMRRGFETNLDEMKQCFTMTVSEESPPFVSFAALAAVASARGTPVLFFIWPLDRELLEKFDIYDEDEFERSRQLIIKNTDKKNIYLADLSGLLEHKFFFDHAGHCTIEGRRKIAHALAPTILDILQRNRSALERNHGLQD